MEKSTALTESYRDLLKSDLVKDEILMKYVEVHGTLDNLLPKSASFFYIIDLATGSYHFLGKQQKSISGVDNEEFKSGGINSFVQRLHPDDANIVINEVYKDFKIWFDGLSDNNERKASVFQYNYRFLSGNGGYINLMEHIHVPELDGNNRASLLLGKVFTIDNSKVFPIRSALKIYREDSVIETLHFKTYNKEIDKNHITKRELDILRNLATGKTSKQIGEQLFISPHTVDTHRRNLLKKLNYSSVVELAKFAYSNGLI